MNTKKSRIHTMTECSLFAALICVCSPWVIPAGPVPFSIGIFAVMLAAVVLNPKRAITSVCVYILIGACGLPVFSGFRGGFAVLAGPTGGYIWSYIIMSGLISAVCNRCKKTACTFAACLASLVICYFFGTLQYALVTGVGTAEAIAVCVLPFAVTDVLKALAATAVGTKLKRILSKQHF